MSLNSLFKLLVSPVVIVADAPPTAIAATVAYTYDAQGHLTKTVSTGSANNNSRPTIVATMQTTAPTSP